MDLTTSMRCVGRWSSGVWTSSQAHESFSKLLWRALSHRGPAELPARVSVRCRSRAREVGAEDALAPGDGTRLGTLLSLVVQPGTCPQVVGRFRQLGMFRGETEGLVKCCTVPAALTLSRHILNVTLLYRNIYVLLFHFVWT